MYETVLGLINQNKASASDITAEEDREVDIAIIDYIKSIAPLQKGVYNIGDTLTDEVHTITFPNIGTASYYVLGSLKGNSTNYDTDNDVFWGWSSPTSTSFKLALREISGNNQNLDFYWELKKI